MHPFFPPDQEFHERRRVDYLQGGLAAGKWAVVVRKAYGQEVPPLTLSLCFSEQKWKLLIFCCSDAFLDAFNSLCGDFVAVLTLSCSVDLCNVIYFPDCPMSELSCLVCPWWLAAV